MTVKFSFIILSIYIECLSYITNFICLELTMFNVSFFIDGSFKKTIAEMSHLHEYITMRKSQAQRSILVQIESMKSYKELISYCNQFGTMSNIYCYTLPKQHVG